MAVRYMKMRLNGGARSSEKVEPPPKSLEVSKHLSSVHSLNDDEGFQTPNRATMSIEPTSSKPRKQKRRRIMFDLNIPYEDEKRPKWLPSDWEVEYRRREGGATAGLTDKYYYEPDSSHQFRSKKEVLCYLETGTRRNYRGKSKAKRKSGVNVTSSKQNGSSSKKRKRSGLNTDFDSPPKKVTWVLNSFSEAPGSWTPFINGERVPEDTRKEWDAAFAYHVHGVAASSSKVDDIGPKS